MCFASLGKRLVEAVFIIFCIITINFILIRFMPGDPVVHIIGEDEYLRLEAEEPEAAPQPEPPADTSGQPLAQPEPAAAERAALAALTVG